MRQSASRWLTKAMPWWVVVDCPDRRAVNHAAQACTKAEARALIKRRLGLRRLPAGTAIARVR